MTLVRSSERFIAENGQPTEVTINVPSNGGGPRVIASGTGTVAGFPAVNTVGPFTRLPGERTWVVLFVNTVPAVGLDGALAWSDAFPTACIYGLCVRADPDDALTVRVAVANNTSFPQDYEWALLGIVPP